MTDPTPAEIANARAEAAERSARLTHDMLVDCDMKREAARREASEYLTIIERDRKDLAASQAQVEMLREALKTTAAIIQADRMRTNNHVFEGTWKINATGFTGTVDDALDKANAALSDTQPPEAK